MRKIERFGDLIVPTGNMIQRPNGPGETPPVTPLFGGGGYDPYGEDRAPRGSRMAETTGIILGIREARRVFLATGEVITPTVARDREVAKWEAAGGTRERLFARTDEDVVVWQWARLVPINPQLNIVSDMQRTTIDLTWRLYGDTWHGLRHGNGLELDTDPPEGFDEGLVLDYDGSQWDTEFDLPHHASIATTTLTLNMDGVTPPLSNEGNADVTSIVATITAGDAALTGAMTLTINGVTLWVYTGTIAVGQRLVVHSGNSSVRLTTDLTADAAAGATSLVVTSSASYTDGRTIAVLLDDGTTHYTEVDGAPPDSTHVVIAEGLPSAASTGNSVGVGMYSAITEPPRQMEWMTLEPGLNTATLRYTGGGAGARILFDYFSAHA